LEMAGAEEPIPVENDACLIGPPQFAKCDPRSEDEESRPPCPHTNE